MLDNMIIFDEMSGNGYKAVDVSQKKSKSPFISSLQDELGGREMVHICNENYCGARVNILDEDFCPKCGNPLDPYVRKKIS